MNARIIAAEPGHKLLVYTDRGVDRWPLISFTVGEDGVKNAVAINGDALYNLNFNFDREAVVLLPDGRATDFTNHYTSEAQWVAACRRRRMVHAK